MSDRVKGYDRETLKNHFTQGSLPSEKGFGDLIDSTLNLKDDCFQWSEKNGVEMSVRSAHRRLLSFFRTPQNDHPDWSITSEEKSGALHFVPNPDDSQQEENDPVPPGILTLASEGGRVGIGVAAPAYDLDVAGVVKSSGRIGVEGKVKANGAWQDITQDLTGCQAFELVAGVGGDPGKGRYALMRAYAMNAYNPTGLFNDFLNRKKRIRCEHAWYGSRGDKLKVRWEKAGAKHQYKLQLKSNTNFGDGFYIQFSLTRLWFDTNMANSRIPPENGVGL